MLAVCLERLAVHTRTADMVIAVDNASTGNTAAGCDTAGAKPIHWPLPAALMRPARTSWPRPTPIPVMARIGWPRSRPTWQGLAP